MILYESISISYRISINNAFQFDFYILSEQHKHQWICYWIQQSNNLNTSCEHFIYVIVSIFKQHDVVDQVWKPQNCKRYNNR